MSDKEILEDKSIQKVYKFMLGLINDYIATNVCIFFILLQVRKRKRERERAAL